MVGLHIGRSPAYSAEMIPDRCCLGSPTSFPTSSHRPHSTEPHMAGFASRSELLQRRSMASTGPPAGRPPRREGQQQWPDTSSGGPVTEAGRTVIMPEQDLDGLVLAIQRDCMRTLPDSACCRGARVTVPGRRPPTPLATSACTSACSAGAAAVPYDRPGGATWCLSAPTRRASEVWLGS
jgi:hypothetical protein